MRKLGVILFFCGIAQCYGSAFDADTIDNWQIYNGTDLLLAGHSPGTGFQATIKRTGLTDLEIQYNHCVRLMDTEVIIELTDEKGQAILTKKFKINSGERMIIRRKELGQLTSKVLVIRYIEKRENGTDQKLGQIRLE